jgi:hypothetical protein
LGQQHQFRAGDKAPNNGIYIEVGETNSNVNHPKMIKLKAGEKFPRNSNHNRKWTYHEKV